LNGDSVSALESATGGAVQDERGSGAGAKLDEQKLAQEFAATGDLANHALAKTSLVAGVENDQIGGGQSFDTHDFRIADGALRDQRSLKRTRASEGEGSKQKRGEMERHGR